ncbi:MAG: hydroxyacylglutathione hydrolase [Myxococcota bacterium]|jgi:hydroxyacylglutathione hydrolase
MTAISSLKRHPLLVTLLTLGLVCVVGFAMNHRMAIVRLLAPTLPIPALGYQTNEGSEAYWYDDYFIVSRIDDDTYAIGEPRYHQGNFNYLILGTSRAILFDSGPGLRDIAPVVRSLTSLPVTTAVSHLHYDHVGHFGKFEAAAMLDIPPLRWRDKGDVLEVFDSEHLGFIEHFANRALVVTEWWAADEPIDLGGRRIIVRHTPGHTGDSMILEDPERSQFFTGDTFYPGELYAFLPGSSLGAYAETVERLLMQVDDTSTLYGAHRLVESGVPTLTRQDLLDFSQTLERIHNETASYEGFFPRSYKVNDNLSILTDVPWGQDWSKSYEP